MPCSVKNHLETFATYVATWLLGWDSYFMEGKSEISLIFADLKNE